MLQEFTENWREIPGLELTPRFTELFISDIEIYVGTEILYGHHLIRSSEKVEKKLRMI